MENKTKKELIDIIKDLLLFHLDNEEDNEIAIEYITSTYNISLKDLKEMELIINEKN
jgi:hypothetical protein